jgi:hypothetical protein
VGGLVRLLRFYIFLLIIFLSLLLYLLYETWKNNIE